MAENCLGRETIVFGGDSGPIVLEILAGFATRGKYRVAIRVNGEWRELEGGDVSDADPDLRVIPVEGAALETARLLIVGKYAPAHIPSGSQISIDYVFRQEGDDIHRSEIRREKEGATFCHYSYEFEAST
jgi:hypothetical protein